VTCLSDHNIESLGTLLAGWGHKPVHARKLLRAYYDGAGEMDLDALPIGSSLRERLRRDVTPVASRVRTVRRSLDGTAKFLVEISDGDAVEAVLMPGHRSDRAAGCVSSQVGCAMGCDFCASTRAGLRRNLAAGEIVEQFLHLKSAALALGRRITSLVFMGMGEPLSNFDNVVAAVERIASPELGSLGWRQVTVSTVGLVPGIDRLADADLNVNLAVSLHAPDDATRSRIVPMNRKYPVAEVMDATRRFASRTGRIPTIEYCMLAGVNDSDEQAVMLAELVNGLRAHVNLIPYNSIGVGISGAAYDRPTRERVGAFLDILRARGVVTHARDTRGDDVNAACGQLRETVVQASSLLT
jgi:23S rRNA (adenine2503-C2)-methyltransferase